jgi:hypothetical protein
MPYSGNTFQRLYSWVTDAAANIKIRADRMDAETNGIADALTTLRTESLRRDGAVTVTGNQPFGGFKITGLGNATADTDALNRITADGRFMTGPGSAVDDHIVLFDGVTGKLVKTSGQTIATAISGKADKAGDTFTGGIVLPAATTVLSPLRVPHGTAPTSPTDGDIWSTTAGVFARINGSTVGPFVATVGAPWTVIQTQTVTGTPAAVDFSSIPATYEELRIEISAGSHDHGSGVGLRYRLSIDNGSNMTAVAGFGSAFPTNVQPLDAAMTVPDYRRGYVVVDGMSTLTAAPTSAFLSTTGFRMGGAIDFIRLQWELGNWDAGTLTLLGR